MSKSFAVLFLFLLPLFAGQVRVTPGSTGPTDTDILQYDDGTYNWLVWGGMYRGMWFNTQDFDPGSYVFYLEQMEYWFYEHPSYPWDTDQFYSEIWNGDDMGPLVQLAQGIVTALHVSPVYHTFDPALVCEQNFWGLDNSEMSAGGWPSILASGTYMGPPEHSYSSDDFIVWEPFPSDPYYGDWFIRAHGEFQSLNSTTWGAVKALF
jgi:hypothetical protein